MNASELFKAGRLQAALDAQLQEVKAKPGDNGKRLFLFDLAVFAGDLERAKRQIEAVQYDAPELQIATIGYRKLVEAEEKRRKVFKDGIPPKFLSDPPEHVQMRLQAVNLLRENKQTEAAELLTKANEQAPKLKGLLNGKAFDEVRDADDLFGTVLEVLAPGGDYCWVPLEQVESIATNAPKSPRDLYWLAARVTLTAGQQGEAHLCVLYPGSHEATDEGLKLGRATDWTQKAGGPMMGVGAKMFLVGEDGMPLAEWRELQIL